MSKQSVPDMPPREPFAVVGIYGELVTSVMTVTGNADTEWAERVVDAVLGPLKLLPPIPVADSGTDCDHVYFAHDGVWHSCVKEHAEEDENADDARHHHSRGRNGEEWTTHSPDGRSFVRKGLSGVPHQLARGDDRSAAQEG